MLLNVAFPEDPAFALLCPYDTARLDHATIANAVGHYCSALGTDAARSDDFVVAANEILANSLRHGAGRGSYALWHDDDVVYCEVRDGGEITDPLVGRVKPSAQPDCGRGVWCANQLCDLVQVRTGPTGTVVRLHLKR